MRDDAKDKADRAATATRTWARARSTSNLVGIVQAAGALVIGDGLPAEADWSDIELSALAHGQAPANVT